MAERILIPLDGSITGEAALRYIEETISKLKPEEKPEIILLHVVASQTRLLATEAGPIEVPYSEKELEQARKMALEYLEKTAENLRNKGAVVKIKVAAGKADEEIVKAERELDADLVAMSTHGRSGLSRWAFGSVTDKVLRGGKVPVLMVRVSYPSSKSPSYPGLCCPLHSSQRSPFLVSLATRAGSLYLKRYLNSQ